MAATVKFTTIGSDVDLTSTSVNPSAAPTSTPRQGGFTLRNRLDFGQVSAANKSMWTIDDATLNDDAVKNFRILKVPERTFVKEIKVMAVASETTPQIRLSGAKASNASISASDLDAAYLVFGADVNKKPESSSSYAAASHLVHVTALNSTAQDVKGAVAGNVFGIIKGKVAASDADWSSNTNWVFLDKFKAVDSSIASATKHPNITARRIGPAEASAYLQRTEGHYFPYGGYVTLRLGPHNASLASDVTAAAAFYSGTTAATFSLHGVWDIQADCNYVPE